MNLLRRLIGKPRDLRDPHLFRRISLAAFLAWVGLGSDGLSSSAYGPEEAFRHLEGHHELAILLAIATALTVFIISYSYSRIIEEFPTGGGGYVVASKLLGERAGVVSGAALLVDYVLTISISIASGANAVFAFLPQWAQPWKFQAELAVLGVLVLMNLRGVKESVATVTPIFVAFVVTHVVVILGAILPHLGEAGTVARELHTGLTRDLSSIGAGALALVFLRAYSLGGGTYTGIEAVSNGLAMMREPRVQTGKRTMVYLAVSLAFTAGGILIAYLLLGIRPSETEPMNAVLAKTLAADWRMGSFGEAFVVLTLLSEGALLFIAAQTGFMDGPRVMANMALDRWLPQQLSALSERLTIRNGVYLMGIAAAAVLLYTRGNVHHLVIMYSINVFLTFSLSNLGMSRHSIQLRGTERRWWRRLGVHLVALAMCAGILAITLIEKFSEGGWLTLLVTGCLLVLCYRVRAHYRAVGRELARLNAQYAPLVNDVPDKPRADIAEMDPIKPTAVVLVSGFGGLGAYTLLDIERIFPGQFHQVVFISVGIIDTGSFKGSSAIEALQAQTEQSLEQYVKLAKNKLGWAADCDYQIGTEAISELEALCRSVYLRFPRSVFFAGKLIFREVGWWQRLLHNETAHAVQRRLEADRLPMIILPVRVPGY